LEALAAQGYRSGKLTHAEAQRMLGFNSPWQTDAFLKQEQISIMPKQTLSVTSQSRVVG